MAALVADRLIEEARTATGLERFDDEGYREGLDVLLADLAANPVADAAAPRLHAALVKALADRLKVTAYLEARPELLDRPVKRPVFVFGLPRTGTTLLSNLLACDPARRSPLAWEIDDPVPPASAATLTTDPRAQARLAAERAMLAARPEAGKYYRSSAIYPNECIFFMAHDFKALVWEGKGKLTGYRDWLYGAADLTPTYRYHKRFLQLLQADAPGTWNLKMPSHILWLETLLTVYPDARLVWTHRDPLTAVGSYCSLMTLPWAAAGGEIDHAWIGRNCAWQAERHAARGMDARDRIGARSGADPVIDIHYADLMREPLATMRRLYRALGDEFTPAAEAAMRAWLADNPQDKFGRHEYRLARYGLTPEGLRDRFARYLARFDVEAEG